MARKRPRPLIAACILERHDNHILIALPKCDNAGPRLWLFPRGLVDEVESAESGMRRICRDELGVEVDIVVGQPPLITEVDESECEIRFFFCGIVSGEADAGTYQEIRWVSRIHLSEYDFDPPSQPVVSWLLETPK